MKNGIKVSEWLLENSIVFINQGKGIIELLKKIDKPIKVAVMGCEVNGPGEAKDADVGIAAGNGRAVIFRKGKKSQVVPEANMIEALMQEISSI